MRRISSRALFGKLANLCDLDGALGAAVVRRALGHKGYSPESASYEDYRRALPAIGAVLRAHKSDREIASVMEAMSAIVGTASERPPDLDTVTTGLRRQTADLSASLNVAPRLKKYK